MGVESGSQYVLIAISLYCGGVGGVVADLGTAAGVIAAATLTARASSRLRSSRARPINASRLVMAIRRSFVGGRGG